MNLSRRDRAPVERPHAARPSRPSKRAERAGMLSRLGRIVAGVMDATGTSAAVLAVQAGYSAPRLSQVLREADRPMSLDQAQRLLKSMNHVLEFRARPVSEED